jgi:two-component system cell cycle sensor histidine kinase PleC
VGLGCRQGGHLLVGARCSTFSACRCKGEILSFGEVAGRLHPDDAQLETIIEGLLNGEISAFDQEFRMRHEDGHWVWLRARAALAPGTSHGGRAASDRHRLRHHTQQKITDRLNMEAEVRLKDAVENISEAFVLWDADNRLVLCNSKYQQFHSLPASVCVPGTAYRTSSAPPGTGSIRQIIGLTKGEAPAPFEVQLGDRRWLQINERRTKDGGFVSVGTDITALKKQEENLLSSKNLMETVRDLQKERQLPTSSRSASPISQTNTRSEKARAEAANRSKSEFLANMSHELRTPLNAIIGFSEMMTNAVLRPLGTAKYVEYANDIRRSGQFLLDVINDILDMSKIEAGRLDLEIERGVVPRRCSTR